MTARPQHTCSTTGFEAFSDSALGRSLVDRFEEQVALHQDCVAVVDGGRAYTYGELDAWANGIAHAIVARGTSGEPVVLVVSQGVGYAASVLGTLKSGSPYVPLDPTDPVERLRSLVDGCGAHVVVTDERNRELAVEAASGTHVVAIDELPPEADPPGVPLGPDDLAYIFFTSGSTGVPKGVFDTHRNVLHNVLRYTNALEIAPSDRLTLLPGPSFSGCVSSQFGALLNGAASCPFRLREEGLLRAARWVREEHITIYHSVPSVFRAVVRSGGPFENVRIVRLEGDRATAEDVALWRERLPRSSALANGLGATETGLARQLIVRDGAVSYEGALPVGYPVRDMQVVVVDERREPVADGDTGEIAVASEYLALGYWRQPDLTAEKFEARNGTRVYYTGDLGRLHSDGCLEYLGRKEGDLKVLGTRVEPAEVEGELLRLESVRDAAVAVRAGSRGEGRVVAFVVPESKSVELGSLRAALAQRLSSAALPTRVVELDRIPIGPNGKVDRRALPDTPKAFHRAAVQGDSREAWLARVWAEVLGLEEVQITDDFFALGGDSLAAGEILARIEVETGNSLPLGTFLRAPTVGALAELLDGGEHGSASVLSVLRDGSEPPLVFLHGNTGNTLHYARLIDRMGGSHALWGLEYAATDDHRVETIASRHVQTLVGAQPEGPYHLVGFCYGAVIAREMAIQLTSRGEEIGLLALLALTPLEFPTLLELEAGAPWSAVYGPDASIRGQVRHHLRQASRLSPGRRVSYLAGRGRNLLARPFRRASAEISEVQRALMEYSPGEYSGQALIVLHARDAAAYTRDPEHAWDALAASADVVLLRGSDHDMLEEPGVEALTELLARSAPSAAPRRA